jgi:hypothetical protein
MGPTKRCPFFKLRGWRRGSGREAFGGVGPAPQTANNSTPREVVSGGVRCPRPVLSSVTQGGRQIGGILRDLLADGDILLRACVRQPGLAVGKAGAQRVGVLAARLQQGGVVFRNREQDRPEPYRRS